MQDAYSHALDAAGASAPCATSCAGRASSCEIEVNGVGDNPIFLPEDKVVLTGANFQGTPVSMPIDHMGGAITMVCVLCERRLNRLTNPALSVGLPAFLTKGAGMFSGLMLSQYTADMQIVEQKILSTPAYHQSIPAAADQEDFVSMGMNSALKTRQILDTACGVLGIELMAAAQAPGLPQLRLRQGHAGGPRGDPPARGVPRRGPAALSRPQRDGGAGQERRDPRGRRGRGGRAGGVLAALAPPRPV